MTTMKKMLCIVLAFALLLTFGCKKDDKTETQDVPETPDNTVEAPPVEQPPVEDPTPAEPVINTWPSLTPDKVIHEKDVDTLDLDAREAAFNSYREVGYFIEWQLGSEYRVIETIPGEKDGEYLLWGMRIKEPGIREPFQMQVKVTPDGKPVDPEERVQENEYHLIPGLSYTKDPTLTVKANSELSYIRILVTIEQMDKIQAALGQDFLPETVVTGWDSALWPCVATVNNGDGSYTYEFRYAQTVDTMDGKDLELKPLFTSFTVPGKLTGAQMQTLKDVKIVVEGHAIQANPFTSADEAWAAFAEQYNTQQGNG